MKRSTAIQVLVGLLLAGAGFWVFFRNVNIAQLWLDIRATPLWSIAGVVAFTFLTLWLRTVRWNIILPASPGASRRDLFKIVMVSFMINNLIPMRAGEAARVFLLWKRNKFTLAESLGSLLLERIFDSLVFLSFLLIPVFFLPSLRSVLPIALPAAVGLSLVICALFLYAMAPAWAKGVGSRLFVVVPQKFRGRIASISKELVSNLDWVFSLKKSIAVIILSIAAVGCHAAMMMMLAHDRNFGLLSGMFGTATAAIGAAIPLAPGYAGTLHAALQQGLVMTGCEASKAGAIAALYHAVSYLTVTIVGLAFFFQMGISFKDIGKAKQRLKENDAEAETAPSQVS